MIYFDSTATTKPRQEVLDTYLKVVQNYWENPSSIYLPSVKANALFEKSKEVILKALNLKNHEIIFTSNATEANNLAIQGIVNNYYGKGFRIITSKIEHPSVYNLYKELETKGFDVKYLDVDEKGIVDLKQLENLMNKDTLIVSIMYVNNIIGTIEPINEIIKIVKQYPRCKLHVDMVQALGKVNLIDLNDIDLMTISSHKIEGIKGVACLIKKKNLNLTKVLIGSNQQEGIKPGTIDTAGAASMAKAVQLALNEQNESFKYVKALRDNLISELEKIDEIKINSNDLCSPFIVSISYYGYKAETLLHYLEEKEIYVSVGSACAAQKETPERTILETTKDLKRATSSIRISLSHLNTIDDINKLIYYLKEFKRRRKNV